MQAVRIHRFGEPEVMALDRPIPAANEVVAASVNPVDAKMPEGKYPVVTEQDLPYVLCRDVSGQIAAVGDEVSSGDDVFAFLSPEHGGYEEFVWRGLTRWLPSQVQWTRSGRPPCRSLVSPRGGASSNMVVLASQRVLAYGLVASGKVEAPLPTAMTSGLDKLNELHPRMKRSTCSGTPSDDGERAQQVNAAGIHCSREAVHDR
jgi:hypothetical protein